jgi:inosine-uridine nucleoside N-ribohydrolase
VAVTENALRFMELAGASIPAARGLGAASRSRVDATSFHGADGRRGVSIAALFPRELPSARALLSQSLARAAPRVIALGPLTNIADSSKTGASCRARRDRVDGREPGAAT